jgi:hypothetical protein
MFENKSIRQLLGDRAEEADIVIHGAVNGTICSILLKKSAFR